MTFLADTVEFHGNKTAIIDGVKRLSFQELDTAAKRLGTIIHNHYQIKKQPIAVFLPKSAESIVAFMGILYSGNFYVPLDENLPAARIKIILGNLNPALIITSPNEQEILLGLGCSWEQLLFVSNAYDHGIEVNEPLLSTQLDKVIDTDPVYIIYTSGSTGIPKGVVVSHRSVVDYIEWAVDCFEINSRLVIGNQSPFYFDNSTLDIYLMLATGATMVIIPKHFFAFPMRLMEYVNNLAINFIFWVPSVMIQVANLRILEKMGRTGLVKILFAGEVMPNKHLNYWRQCIPQALFANLYGPTEITVDCTFYIVDRCFEDHEPLPIGIPCKNSDILVLNAENKPVTGTESGELCVRGSSLALGYWNDPVKTEAAFVQNPLQNNYPERIYRTGDVVCYNCFNEILYLGRKDSQIKHLGYRIELGEIETAVLGLSGINNACVIYDKEQGEIILYYQADRKMNSQDICSRLAVFLPKYMIPTQINYLDELPFNPNGKIDRVALAAGCRS